MTADAGEPENQDEEAQKSLELVEAGGEMAGAAVGGALGLIGGPAGVAAGAVGGVVVTRTLKLVGAELHDRVLSWRQRTRAGAAYAVIGDDVHQRLEAGDAPREDQFFEADASGRSSAAELLEGTLIHAANAYEECKVKYLGHLYSSTLFDASIGAAQANYLLRVAERLTYRQLVALKLIGSGRWQNDLIQFDAERGEGTTEPWPEVAEEITELGRDDLVGVSQAGGQPTPMTQHPGGGILVKGLGRAGLRPVGERLFQLMRLDEIADEDAEALLADLRVRRS